MLIDITTFRLAAGVDDKVFLQADAHAQAALSSQPGFVRRTTARATARLPADDGGGGGGGGGAQSDGWLVLTFWSSAADADAAGGAGVGSLDAMVDASTVRVERYESLD